MAEGWDRLTVGPAAADDLSAGGELETFVHSHPQASIYHEPAWLRHIAGSYGVRPLHLLARRRKELVGFLPLFVMRTILGERVAVSSPFSNYGGLLATSPEAAAQLRDAAAAQASRRHCRYVEIKERRPNDWPDAWVQAVDFCSPVIDLRCGDASQLWKHGLRPKTRNQVRKSIRSGLTMREAPEEQRGDFLKVHDRAMRDLGTPAHGRRWFRSLFTLLAARARVYVVYHEGDPVAAALLLRESRGAVLQNCLALLSSLEMCPNNLIYWRLIEQGIEQGWEYLDLGRSRIGSGTYRYKMQWGAEAVISPYMYHFPRQRARPNLPSLHPDNPAFGALIRIWQRLPVGMARWIGPAIRRHITT
ncbi:MAG: GNAT family N-acetyltransferase [Candidatus Eisenbacteria sp.]|nr:GNAT family N-acetyltransferase [Candidatus Eisenbacteria bacterium]